MKAWDVIEQTRTGERIIDTVFYDDDCSAQYVYSGLSNHDGYDAGIRVQCRATDEEWPDRWPEL